MLLLEALEVALAVVLAGFALFRNGFMNRSKQTLRVDDRILSVQS